MTRYIFKRILLALVQVLLVMTFVFLLLRIMPGDPAVLALGTDHAMDEEAVQAMRTQLGLDKPIFEQYIVWMRNAFKLDLGNSTRDGSSVLANLKQRFPRTLELVIVAVVLASVFGVCLGVISAVRRNTFLDRALVGISATGISLPVYVLGALLIMLFSLRLKWLPSGSFIAYSKNPHKHILRLILPSVTIAFGTAASIARMTRSSVLETLEKDYIKTLRAKGVKEFTIILSHALRNAIAPIITTIGLQLGNLIGGTVLVESLFTWPGINTLLVSSISMRDYPMIQGCVLCVAVFYILINLLVDVLYKVLDPRI